MKVAVFAYTNDAPTLETGVTTYNRQLIRALCEKFPDHELSIYLAPRNAKKFSDIEAPNLRKIVLEGGPDWDTSPFGGGGGKIANAMALAGFIARETLDRLGLRRFPVRERLFDSVEGLAEADLVIYTVFGYLPDFPLYVRRKLGLPCICSIHDIRVLYDDSHNGSPLSWQIRVLILAYRYILGRVVRESKLTLVPSMYIRNVLVGLHRCHADRIKVSYVVPDIGEVAADTVSPAVRSILQSRTRYVFYPSTIVATKNHLMLARAVDLLRREVPDILLVLAGSNRDSDIGRELFGYIADKGLERNIVHLGFISDADKMALYRSAVALVVPSIGESFSLPIWEAFAEGCPVVASTDRDIPEQVAGAAVPCNPHDPADIAGGLRKVWRDEDLRRNLAERGRARYEQARRESLFSGWESVLQ